MSKIEVMQEDFFTRLKKVVGEPAELTKKTSIAKKWIEDNPIAEARNAGYSYSQLYSLMTSEVGDVTTLKSFKRYVQYKAKEQARDPQQLTATQELDSTVENTAFHNDTSTSSEPQTTDILTFSTQLKQKEYETVREFVEDNFEWIDEQKQHNVMFRDMSEQIFNECNMSISSGTLCTYYYQIQRERASDEPKKPKGETKKEPSSILALVRENFDWLTEKRATGMRWVDVAGELKEKTGVWINDAVLVTYYNKAKNEKVFDGFLVTYAIGDERIENAFFKAEKTATVYDIIDRQRKAKEQESGYKLMVRLKSITPYSSKDYMEKFGAK